MDVPEALALLSADPPATGLFTDFDGTLSPIVDRPDLARPVPGVPEVLASLASKLAVVAVVSGRALDDLRPRIDAEGVLLAGSYGRERSDRPSSSPPDDDWGPIVDAVEEIERDLPGVLLERKGHGFAIHYRAAPVHEDAVDRRANEIATRFGLEVLEGRLVRELVRPGPNKGDAVAAIASERGLGTLVVAGDDVGDLRAFEWARSSTLDAVLVAVVSEEASPELTSMADLVMGAPEAFVAFIRKLDGSLA